MDTTKYGKYILTEQGGSRPEPGSGVTPVLLEGIKDWGGIHHRMKWKFVTAPGVMVDTPHRHDFDDIYALRSGHADSFIGWAAGRNRPSSRACSRIWSTSATSR